MRVWSRPTEPEQAVGVAAPDVAVERRALLVSIAVTAVLGALGLVAGVVSGSQMVLLDGVFALIAILVSWLLLRAAELAGSEPTTRYPFGREAITPLVIGVQGFVLLGTLVYAASEAVLVIRAGGSELVAGLAIAYGVTTTVASWFTWRWLRGRAGHSDVLVAEATAWRVAALRGGGMVIGFSVIAALESSSWSRAAPYVDPAMVLVTCAMFVRAPLGMVRSTIVELLEGAPDRSIQSDVQEVVDVVGARHGLDTPSIRMTKLGPKLYVEVVADVRPSVTVAEQQRLYDELHASLDRLPYDIWLNVELAPRPSEPSGVSGE